MSLCECEDQAEERTGNTRSLDFKLLTVLSACVVILSAISICITLYHVCAPRPQDDNQEHIRSHAAMPVVSAHKALVLPTGDQDKRTLRIDHEWDLLDREHANNIILTPTGLQVKHPGLYYVYRSLYFILDPKPRCRDHSNQNIISKLQKIRGFEVHDLLTSAATSCIDCKDEGITSFSGGIFKLQEGDTIQVHISEEASCVLKFREDRTYLGLSMIRAS